MDDDTLRTRAIELALHDLAELERSTRENMLLAQSHSLRVLRLRLQCLHDGDLHGAADEGLSGKIARGMLS